MEALRSEESAVPAGLHLPRERFLEFRSRPLVMGVLNITPDSFSDRGRFADPERAVARGLEMLGEGADLLDLGAESTRPGGGVYGDGAREVSVAEELERLLPVLERLRAATDAPLSVDTRKGAVARAALAAGADLINDVSALADPELGLAVAESGCPIVLMHSRGSIRDMQRNIRFADVLAEVAAELEEATERARGAGIPSERMILDPGIGFGKTAVQNLELLQGIERLRGPGCALLVGASRKSFIGEYSGATVADRLPGSLAALAWAARGRAEIVRVHDVAESLQFLEVWGAIDRAGEDTP